MTPPLKEDFGSLTTSRETHGSRRSRDKSLGGPRDSLRSHGADSRRQRRVIK